MELNKLTKITQKNTKVGRGVSAGQGKTAGRGTKGQKSRTGSSTKFFEGGQTPIWMRLPKAKGFNARSSANKLTVTIAQIKANFKESEVISATQVIEKMGLNKKSLNAKLSVKVIGDQKEIAKYKFDETIRTSGQKDKK